MPSGNGANRVFPRSTLSLALTSALVRAACHTTSDKLVSELSSRLVHPCGVALLLSDLIAGGRQLRPEPVLKLIRQQDSRRQATLTMASVDVCTSPEMRPACSPPVFRRARHRCRRPYQRRGDYGGKMLLPPSTSSVGGGSGRRSDRQAKAPQFRVWLRLKSTKGYGARIRRNRTQSTPPP